jgi:MFS family permease
MQFAIDVRTLLGFRYFRRLFSVRLVSQFADGIFQVALASYVLFSPERQPNAMAIAVSFAILLLPFSVLGPFCGVLIDRWSRRQLLLYTNLARFALVAVVAVLIARDADGPLFFALVLAAFSLNRFVLAALSASLPHVVPDDRLVMANAVSPTCGTLAYLLGLAAGTGITTATGSDGIVVGLASVTYVGAALLALRMPRRLLGPDLAHARQDVREAVRHVVAGLVDGTRHVLARKPAAYGLGAIGAHRLSYGISTMATILLYRNLFSHGDIEAGLAGMASVVLISGLGFGTAAFLTPIAVRRIGKQQWIIALLVLAAVAQLGPAAFFTPLGISIAAFLLGISAQGIKICVDTLVQENVDDVYRGRVFSLYDVLFNVVLVGSATLAALVLPATGKSYLVLIGTGLWYLLTAYGYRRMTRAERTAERQAEVASSMAAAGSVEPSRTR